MKALIFTPLLIAPITIHAQSAEQWQAEHPNGILLSTTIHSSLSAKELSMLGSEIFIFDSNAGAHEKSASGNKPGNQPTSGKDDAVKAWLANHPDVLIVKHSEALTANDSLQQIIADHHALILAGEILTFEDVENYPY